MTTILGLDLQGDRLGWAVLRIDGDGRESVCGGVVPLGLRYEPGARKGTLRRVERRSLRALDLRGTLRRLIDEHAPEVVAYEQVIAHGKAGSAAAHAWGAAELAVLEVCEGMPVDVRTVGVCAAKLALAGDGKAGKAAMALRARQRWGAGVDWWEGDHDAADAAGVALAVVAPGETKAARAKREAAERRAAKGAA